MPIEQSSPKGHRLWRDQALARQHRFLPGAIDRDDGNRVANRIELRELTAELESGGGGVRKAGLDRGHVGTREAVIRGMRPAVDANLHAPDAGRIERPSGDAQRRIDDRFGRRRVDRADGRDYPRCRLGCNRRRTRRCRRSGRGSGRRNGRRLGSVTFLPCEGACYRQRRGYQQRRGRVLFPEIGLQCSYQQVNVRDIVMDASLALTAGDASVPA